VLNIEFVRRDRRLSQEKLGQLTDIPQSFISLLELGRGIPTPEQAQRLALVLDLTPDVLLKPAVIVSDGTSPADVVKLVATQRVERARARVAQLEEEVRQLAASGVTR
jgi:transcriptional regulator with XRE-family HTH domain